MQMTAGWADQPVRRQHREQVERVVDHLRLELAHRFDAKNRTAAQHACIATLTRCGQ
ncbi:hypothetical protein [Streptomyces sp. NPDC002520]